MQKSLPVKIPLATRFKAWWEGYDIHDLEARLHENLQNQVKPNTPSNPARTLALPPLEWNNARIEISQYIWGDEYCGPGGPDYVTGISKLLILSPEMSMMVLGAGLGGPARALAHEFGVWVTGYEASKKLATEGMELSTRHGMAKKAPILHYDPETPEPFERTFDCALIKDSLFTVANKLDLLRKVNSKLKVDSLVLVTDYVMKSATFRENPAYEQWKVQEPLTPYLYTHDEENELFNDAGFTLRVNEDVSEHFVELITSAWANVDTVVARLMEQGDEGKAKIAALLHEAEFWSLRAKLLESGDLQMCRILASKKADKNAPIR